MTEAPVGLVLGGTEVARYVLDPALDARHGPRPYLHPVRTLGGTVVTDALPADHVWHLGASLAVQDVNGANLWGGRTYVRDVGYTWRDDHGVIAHTGEVERGPDRYAHDLQWRDRAGRVLLTEHRQLAAVALSTVGPAGQVSAWRLEVDYTLSAPAGQDVRLGSPATNGRPVAPVTAGSSGGRSRPNRRRCSAPRRRGGGGQRLHRSLGRAPWHRAGPAAVHSGLQWSRGGDRWFTRTAMYPGVGWRSRSSSR
ncbi:DUF6807 family protein [Micromonospora sp. M12]